MGIFISREDVRQEVEQIKAGFEARIVQMESTLLAEIQKSLASVQASTTEAVAQHSTSVQASVKEAVGQHSHTVPFAPQIDRLRNRVDYFADKMAEITQVLSNLASEVHQLTHTVGELSPNLPDGAQKPIHEVISVYTQRIVAEVANMQLAHAQWLEEHTRGAEEARKAAITTHHLIEQSILHITPQPKSDLNGAVQS